MMNTSRLSSAAKARKLDESVREYSDESEPMLVPKKNRIAVYSYLFKEGVVVAPKTITIDHKVIGVPNLEVVKLMISMKSRGYVRENFCWNHHYFYLTDKGIEYLRDYLHLPADIIPATLKKPVAAPRPAGFRPAEGEAEAGKDGGPSGDFKPSFRGGREEGYRREGGGFGRGRAM